MIKLANKYLTKKNLLLFALTASSFALIVAYVSQYVFDLQPCQFCLWQRKPFFAIIILAIMFLKIPNLKKYQNLALKIIILLLLINAAISFYHTGIEQKWFKGFNSCSSSIAQPTTLEELKTYLEKMQAVRCDKPQFVFLGLSMAAWNFIYCLLLAILIVIIKKPLMNNKPQIN